MFRVFLVVFLAFLVSGCSFGISGINNDSAFAKKLALQKQKSDEEVLKLKKEIQKLEMDKEKYKQEYEKFNNNPILDELDETLGEEDTNSDINSSVDSNKTVVSKKKEMI